MRVNVDSQALSDRRFDYLASLIGQHKWYVQGMFLNLWNFCYERRSDVMTAKEVKIHSGIDPALIVEAELADILEEGRYRIKGVAARIEWLLQKDESAKRGGEASAHGRQRDDKGRFLPRHAIESIESPVSSMDIHKEAEKPSKRAEIAQQVSSDLWITQVGLGKHPGGSSAHTHPHTPTPDNVIYNIKTSSSSNPVYDPRILARYNDDDGDGTIEEWVNLDQSEWVAAGAEPMGVPALLKLRSMGLTLEAARAEYKALLRDLYSGAFKRVRLKNPTGLLYTRMMAKIPPQD